MQSQQRSIEETAIVRYVAPQNVERAVTLWRLAVSAGQTGVNVYRELQNAGITWNEARQVYREITNELSRQNINWNDYAQRITTRLVNEAERVQPNDRYSTIMGTLGAAAGGALGTMGGLPGIVAGGIAGHQAGTIWGNAVPNGRFRQFINGESPLPEIGVETMPTNPQIGQTPLTSEATPVKEIGIGGKAHNPKTPMSDKSSEPTPAPEAEAAAARRAGGGGPGGGAPGGGNPQSKETPISSYPSISYGLQETHTTILPWTGWITAAKMDTGAPIQLRVRLNAPIDMIDATIIADPGAGVLFPSKGLYERPSAEDMKGATVDYPERFVTGATTVERPAWRDYWMALYEYYTVLGCEYKITLINPISTMGSAVIIGTQFDSYTDTAGASGNEMPRTNLSETLAFKHVEWDIITGFRAEKPNHNATVISGKYTPGQIRRNIQNDGDVKTWIATAGLALPALKDFLTLNFWRAPMATSSVNAVNIQVELKYIVQFKDLKTQARYPNRTTGTALTHILSTNPADLGSALQKWGV